MKSFRATCFAALGLMAAQLGNQALADPVPAAAAAPSGAAPAPAIDHIFLLIGQSNMAGRGKVESADRVPDPRVFALNRANRWVPAVDPIHFDRPDIAGVGPGTTFGRQVAAAHPAWTIGLVPCAVGATSLDQWHAGGPLYTAAVARTRVALQGGARLTAILWHQGEWDEAAPLAKTYVARFAAMIARLRADLRAEAVPVIVGELGRFTTAAANVNPQLDRVPQAVPLCRLVTSEGLTDRGDRLHFDSASARELGRRYAQAFASLRWQDAR